ncbi:hypothetical protein TheveDRAFT_0130 [Thermanaerovibrio velox DSM 12556]|uniref:Uncharacterized protein n=2 Tax=Thermanaerovibrio TaxID=81461 RepID=H0UN38_9BACT|nr:hypothetical protein TheveDRAFT_0130 [Thermanaerovibrio velox DSM 12556]
MFPPFSCIMKRIRVVTALAVGSVVVLWGSAGVALADFRGYFPAIPALPGAVNRMTFVAPEDGKYVLYSASGLGTLGARGVKGEALEITAAKGETLEVLYRYEGDVPDGVMDEAVIAEMSGTEVFRAAFQLGMRPVARRIEVPLAVKGLPRLVRVDLADQLHPSLDLKRVLKSQGGAITLTGSVEHRGKSYPLDPEGWAVLPPEAVSGDITVLSGLVSNKVGGALTPVQFHLDLREVELPGEWAFLHSLAGRFDDPSLGFALTMLPKGAVEAGEALGIRAKASEQRLFALGELLHGSDAAKAFLRGYLKGTDMAMVAVSPGADVVVSSPVGGPQGWKEVRGSGWAYVFFPRKGRVLLNLRGNGSSAVEIVKVLKEGEVRRSYPAGTWERDVEVIGDRLNVSSGS